MKIKVIDLVNKMADGEPLPDKVKLECVNSITKENCIYHFNPIAENYINDKGEKLTNATCLSTLLDLEIELIEEKKKIELPEKLEIEQDTSNSNYYIKNEFGTKCGLTKHSKMIADKLNEILDYLKYKEEEKEK